MKTRIIVDSTADLLTAQKAQVHTVPLTVHFGQEDYIDEMRYTTIGSVIGTHAGPGAVAVAFFRNCREGVICG